MQRKVYTSAKTTSAAHSTNSPKRTVPTAGGKKVEQNLAAEAEAKKLALLKQEHEKLLGKREQLAYQIESAQQRSKEMHEEKAFLEGELNRVQQQGEQQEKQVEEELKTCKAELETSIHKLHYSATENEVQLGNYVGSVFEKTKS
ncbi:unnamed protein product [Amoebophrya sp. A120]|nr:unnamed protein product [Amoebophrya sp. A120]|eukprot:GSA120T00004649001.1